MNDALCALPVELKELILSKIEHIEAHHILALSSTFQEAFSLLRALPRTFDFEGVEGVLADHLVRVLDDDRVRSLGKERALQLIGDEKDRLCEYACGRSFEVLRWAHNELDLPWATTSGTGYPVLYPAGPVSDDILVLRVLRETWPSLKESQGVPRHWGESDGWWRVDVRPEEWPGVTMENGRVVKLEFYTCGLTGAVPAEIGQLASLTKLNLGTNQLTSLPANIGQLASLTQLNLGENKLTSLPAEIGQLTSLTQLYLGRNRLTTLPAEIGQLTSLTYLYLSGNTLTSLPAEVGQLASLEWLGLARNQLTSLPAEIGRLTSLTKLYLGRNRLTTLPAEIGQLTSLQGLYLDGNLLTSLPAEIGQLTLLRGLNLEHNQLTSLPAEIGQLTSLRALSLGGNQLTSLPAEIGQLTSLDRLYLFGNQLTSMPAAIRELRAAGCDVLIDDGVTFAE